MNAISTFAGKEMQYSNLFDPEDHWRLTKKSRMYCTYLYAYRDTYIVEPGTYDYSTYRTGYKWQLVKHFLDNTDVSQYKYVGFFDQDIVTTRHNINCALELAQSKQLKYFRMSSTLVGGIEPPITKITHCEGDGWFLDTSLVPLFKKVLHYNDYKQGWGLDYTLPAMLKCKAFQINKYKMVNIPNKSDYTRLHALEELIKTTDHVYPQFMKHTYGEDVNPALPSYFKPHFGTMLQTVKATMKIVEKIWHEQYGESIRIIQADDFDSFNITAEFDTGIQTVCFADCKYKTVAKTVQQYRKIISNMAKHNEV